MSSLPFNVPTCPEEDAKAVDLRIDARPRDLGGFTVRRVLPAPARRLVGPFVFFDHMGPTEFDAGGGIDVRPHPHIGLATVTYLFEGEILHRDSLGNTQPIRPGDVNWMLAGHGIVHSERTSETTRKGPSRLHGIQSWVALPSADEETEPAFDHHPESTIPVVTLPGARLAVVAGSAYGATSPVSVRSPTFYVHALLDAGTTVSVPDEYVERAAYVVEGSVACAGCSFSEGEMVVFRPGSSATLTTSPHMKARVMLLGGAPLGGDRHVFWNFVSSREERIETAKSEWRAQDLEKFPKVPGDDREFIPLP